MIDGEPGDLRFVLRAIPSKRWERRGSDLLINETITLLDALTGGAGPGAGPQVEPCVSPGLPQWPALPEDW